MQEKDNTICKTKDRLMENQNDIVRNSIEIYSLDKMLANTGVRETE